jgi:RNA polymerase primary sigma factor
MSVEAVPVVVEPGRDAVFVVNLAQEEAAPERLAGTGASDDPVKDYLSRIGRVPLLNAELEVELSKRIESGLFASHILGLESKLQTGEKLAPADRKLTTAWLGSKATRDELEWVAEDGRQAKLHMIEANLRLAVSIAKKYQGRGMPYPDLIQYANEGLIRGVEKFDFTKGYKFSTYASWWIRQSITRALLDSTRVIRIPVHMGEKINTMHKEEREFLQTHGREPTLEELAKEMKLPHEKVRDFKKYARDAVSLETPVGEGGARYNDGDTLGDVIEDEKAENVEEAVEFTALQEALVATLDTFTEKEANIISLRFGLVDGTSWTLDDVGKLYGVTRERIRQIESKIMSKLRHPSRSHLLRDYLQ